MTYTIILYHGIKSNAYNYTYKDEHEYEWTLDIDMFRRHMDTIRRMKFDVILLRDLLKGIECRNPLVITFDDGLETDFIGAFPILQEIGYKAEYFVSSNMIDKANYVSSDQLREMRKAGMSIQSHGHNHVFMTSLDDIMITRELRTSKEIISDITGEDVDFYSYPGGRFDDRTEAFVKKTGYKGSLTNRGFNKWGSKKFYGLKRQGMHYNTSDELFRAYISHDKRFFFIQEVKRYILLVYRAMTRKNAMKQERHNG